MKMAVTDLNDENFHLFAAACYDNPGCMSDAEFFEDIARIKYIKKLATRYKDSGVLKERLILNHLAILANVFGRENLVRIMWLKMQGHLPFIKPFLIAVIGNLPSRVDNVRGKNYHSDDVVMDEKIVGILRNLNIR